MNDNFVKAIQALTVPSWFIYNNGDLFDWIKIPFALRDWACDACVTSGLAIVAHFETIFLLNLQCSSGHRPYYYFDYNIWCSTCQKEFVYNKNQQRWAHQEYIISGYATLRDCPQCRKIKNKTRWHQQVLQSTIALARAKPSFENLLKASQLLLEYTDPRALRYLRQAKNKALNREQKTILEVQILEFKA